MDIKREGKRQTIFWLTMYLVLREPLANSNRDRDVQRNTCVCGGGDGYYEK